MYFKFPTYALMNAFLEKMKDQGAKLVSWPYANHGEYIVFVPQKHNEG
jgi:hypothetical protein